jgi:FkbM family methyltransferase
MTPHDIKIILYKIKPFKFLLDIREKWIISNIHKRELVKNNKWNANFTNDNKFIFNLNNSVKINLYKDSVLSKLIYEGNFELDEISFVNNTLKDGDVFIDIGSNIGLFSLIASNLVGRNGKVISFEPSPKTFKRLEENIELNELQNVKLNNIGLSDKKGTLKLHVSENGHDAWDTFATDINNIKYQNSIEVNINTLDNEIENIGVNNIKLIKIDVEGWEKFVLLGAIETIKKFSPILLIEFTAENTENAGYNVLEIYDIVTNLGYRWYRYKKNKLKLEEKKKTYLYDNLIAIK